MSYGIGWIPESLRDPPTVPKNVPTAADVTNIQDVYGHTDPAPTQIYARASLAKHLRAISRLRDTA